MTRLFVVVFLALLSGAARAQSSDVLRIAMRDDPDLLDPTFSRTYVGTVIMTAICDKLFDFDGKLNIVPVLATGYEWADPTTLLIHVRPNVTFQDGEPLDAAAVVYTLMRHLNAPGSFRHGEVGAMDRAEVVDPMTVRVVMKQPFSPFIAALTDRPGMMVAPKAAEAAGKDFGLHPVCAGPFKFVDRVAEVVDPMTVRVVMKQPFSPFIAALTDRPGMMVAPKAAEAAGKDFGLHPVCAGPFKFVDRVAQDHVTLERFPGYWDAGRIHFNRVTYQIIPDSSIRKANLEAGALDLAEVAPLDVDAVSKNPKLAVVSVPGLGYGALTVNVGSGVRAKTPLGEDARVRLAFELAIDRDAVNTVVFGGAYTPNAQATSAISPLYDPALPIPPRDLPRAKALLKEAGVNGPLPVDLLVYNTPQGTQAGEVIQSMAAEAGFDVHVIAAEFGAVIAAVNRGDFQVTLGGWSGLLDTDSNAWSFLHTGGVLNWAHYSNPAVDTLLDQARLVSDVAARRALYGQLWQQESKDLPLIYLWTTRNIQGVSRRVEGFSLLADGLLRLQDLRFR